MPVDMLVNLYTLPENSCPADIRICRVLPPEINRVIRWVGETFGTGWQSECTPALSAMPASCYIAQRNGEIIGFACYDATAKGYFGPIGVLESERGNHIGKALLIECLLGMREAGYGYAVIGWCDHAQEFYRRTVGAVAIPGSQPQDTVYSRMCRFSVHQETAGE